MSDEIAPPSPDEPRAAPRVALELPVRIQLDSGAEYQPAQTTNISATGMFVNFAKPPPVGALLRFELELAEGKTVLRGTAEVIWIRVRWEDRQPPGMGIRFRYLEGEGEALLARALARAARRQPAARQAEGEGDSRPAGFRRSRPAPEPRPLPPAPEVPEERPTPRDRLAGLLQRFDKGRPRDAPPEPAPPPARPARAQPSTAPPPEEKKISGRQLMILGVLVVILLFLLMRLG